MLFRNLKTEYNIFFIQEPVETGKKEARGKTLYVMEIKSLKRNVGNNLSFSNGFDW